jgi:hypothetical protein
LQQRAFARNNDGDLMNQTDASRTSALSSGTVSVIPTNPDALLTRPAFAAALTEAGYPTKPKTLATKATRGGGPPYHRYGPYAVYRWGTGLAWAKARLSPARRSTSEADVSKTA